MTQILITHSPQDEAFARRLETSLTRMGARVRIDADYPPDEPGNDRTTRQRLRVYDALIVIMSPEAVQSERIEREWRHMLHLERAMIPVLVRDVPSDAALNRLEYVDFIRLDYDQALKQLHLFLRRENIRIYDPTAQIFGGQLPLPADDSELNRQGASEAVASASRSGKGGDNWLEMHGQHDDDDDTSGQSDEMPGCARKILIAVFMLIVFLFASFVDESSPSFTTRPINSSSQNSRAELQATLAEINAAGTRLARFDDRATAQSRESATATPEPTATPDLSFNQQWTPVIRMIDGVEMALVPAETLLTENVLSDCLQTNNFDACEYLLDTRGTFWMDVYEASNSNDLPVTGLDWPEADAQCKARGARLPTLAEWQFAAAGPDNLRYPWADTWRYLLFKPANICGEECLQPHADEVYDDGFWETAPVDAFPYGVSWVGVYSLAGNVHEWAISPQNEMTPLLAGGSWNSTVEDATTDSTFQPVDVTLPGTYGFRCVRTYQPDDLARYTD